MSGRRFPPPWTVVQIPGGYRVEDASGAPLYYVYARSEHERGASMDALTWDEARRLAQGVARLPELMGAAAGGAGDGAGSGENPPG